MLSSCCRGLSTRCALNERSATWIPERHPVEDIIGHKPEPANSSSPVKRILEDHKVETGEEEGGHDVDAIVSTRPDENSRGADIIEMLSQAAKSGAGISGDSLIAALVAPRGEFVDTFATINIVRAPAKGGTCIDYARRMDEDNSNSISEMTPYMFQYPNISIGCHFPGAAELPNLQYHELTCSFVKSREDKNVKPKVEKQFTCAAEGCKKVCKGKGWTITCATATSPSSAMY